MKNKNIKTLFCSIALTTIFISCKNIEATKNVENSLKIESIYADINLFTFQPVKFDKIDKNYYVTIVDGENEKAITVVNGKNKNTSVYKKNLKGYYSNVIQTNTEENNLGYKTMSYFVYSSKRIVCYNLHEFSGEPMKLISYWIILPLEKNNTQRKIKYQIEDKYINSFEEIDFEKDLNIPLTDNFEYEMIYEFDFNKKTVHEYSVLRGIKSLNEVYDIKNSRNLASPLKNYWRPLKR
ncbi:hypothetical protein [Flavobacterium sp.]|uniref:hypothetical protein n=1 Tax=Flavobacterium sp. TaxID=239 RepID=UPI002FDA4DDD